MRVFVLTWGYDYESDTVEGVYSSEEAAEQTGKDMMVGRELDCVHYDVTECEVQ